MKNLLFSIFLLFSLCVNGQTYKDSISFKADLWTIDYAEEAVRPEGDSVNFVWTKRSVKLKNNVIYLDVSPKGTLVGIRYPSTLNLSSEGLENNGFIGEVKFSNHAMYKQSYAKDQNGNIWLVTVGKDRYPADLTVDKNGEGRIYVSIQDIHGIQSGWYFCIKTFGGTGS